MIKFELELDADASIVSALRQANEVMGGVATGGTPAEQADALMALLGI